MFVGICWIIHLIYLRCTNRGWDVPLQPFNSMREEPLVWLRDRE